MPAQPSEAKGAAAGEPSSAGGGKDLLDEGDLEKLPEPERRFISRFMAVSSRGPRPNPILEKIEPEHITQMIQGHEKESERRHKERKEKRKDIFLYVILSPFVLCGLAWFFIYLLQDRALFWQIATHLFTLVAGGLGGWGVRAHQNRPAK
ncbi:MAG: hypothetical protein GDA40_00790 [Rhodobacteraceae bacterium]|nr:hypothetical protein [Paracoccaceae bacterium]